MAGSPTKSHAGPSKWSEVSPWRPETAPGASLGRPRHHTARRLEATDPRPTVTTEIDNHRQIDHRKKDILGARLASARCPPPPRPRGVALAPDRPAGADQRRPGCSSRPNFPMGARLARAGCPAPPRPMGVALASNRPAGAQQRRPGCLLRL